MSRRVTPEGSLLRTVGDLLTAERVWWARTNAGVHVLQDKSGRKRVFNGHRPGTADLLALPLLRPFCDNCDRRLACPDCDRMQSSRPVPLWLELKSRRGVQSDAQIAFQSEVEAEGHTYLLVRDVREVETWLKENR